MSLKIFSKEKPSDLIESLVINAGTPAIDCEWCGRTHFDLNGEFMEEGELEELQEKASKDPDKYFGQDGGISWGSIAGKQTVIGCPCNFLTYFEKLVWGHRRLLAEYLSKKAKTELERAQENQMQLSVVEEIIKD